MRGIHALQTKASAALSLAGLAFLACAVGFACSSSDGGGETDCSTLGACLDAAPQTTCDPTLPCQDTQTCAGGQLYPTNCGPENCDEPIGPCDVDAGACPGTITGGEACSAAGQSCPLGCTECGTGSYQRVIDMLCTCMTGHWSCGDAALHCGTDTVGTYEDPSCTVLRLDGGTPADAGPKDAGADGKEKKAPDASDEAGSNLDGGPSRDL